MTLVYNGFSTFRLLAAYQAAADRLGEGAVEATRRCLGRFLLAPIYDLRDSEHHLSGNRESASRNLPGSVFDARYKGLTAEAAHIDAAICRHGRLR